MIVECSCHQFDCNQQKRYRYYANAISVCAPNFLFVENAIEINYSNTGHLRMRQLCIYFDNCFCLKKFYNDEFKRINLPPDRKRWNHSEYWPVCNDCIHPLSVQMCWKIVSSSEVNDCPQQWHSIGPLIHVAGKSFQQMYLQSLPNKYT